MPSADDRRATSLAIAAAEWRFQRTLVAPRASATLLFLVAFGTVATDAVSLGAADIARTGPYALALGHTLCAILLVVAAPWLVGSAVQRDFEHCSADLIGAIVPSTGRYVAGRFMGATLTLALVSLAAPVGMAVASLATHQAPSFATLALRLTSAWATFMLPTIVLGGAVAFAVGTLTRSAFAIYVCGMALLIAALLASSLAGAAVGSAAAALLDPFAFILLGDMVSTWSIVDRSGRTIALGGPLLANRVLWTAVAALLVAWTMRRFSFTRRTVSARTRRGNFSSPATTPSVDIASLVAAPLRRVATAPHWPSQWWALVRTATTLTFRNRVFLAALAIGVVNLLATVTFADLTPDGRRYPSTHVIVEAITVGALPMLIMLTSLVAGDLAARDRAGRVEMILDALPVGSTVTFAARLASLLVTQGAVLALLITVGAAIQAGKGYLDIDVALYVRYMLGVVWPVLVQVALLAAAAHALVRRQAAGHTIVLACWALALVVPATKLPRQLLRPATVAPVVHSDFVGLALSRDNILWHSAWWIAVGATFALIAHLVAPRARERLTKEVGHRVRRRLSPPAWGLALAIGALLLVAGRRMIHATIATPTLADESWTDESRALYERTFAHHASAPVPTLRDIHGTLRIDPDRRRIAISAALRYVNEGDAPIDTLLLTFVRNRREVKVAADRDARITRDETLPVHTVALRAPLVPGDSLTLSLTLAHVEEGFRDDGQEHDVAPGAAVVTSDGWLPAIGYLASIELTEAQDRARMALPAEHRSATARIGARATRVSLRIDVPMGYEVATGGRLTSDRTASGWRTVQFERPSEGPGNFAVAVARYTVRRWSGGETVVELYHLPTHARNVPRILAVAVAASEDYARRFGALGETTLRIAEIPRYFGGAQSFAGMVIMSEDLAFNAAPPRDSTDADLAPFITAHEVAHQWWGNRAVPASGIPATLVSEGVAQYAAHSFITRHDGAAASKALRDYERGRYERGRALAPSPESPLATAGRESYLAYSKALLAFATLRDSVGEGALDGALRALLERDPRTAPPLGAAELVRGIAAALPARHAPLVHRLFETTDDDALRR